jgi:hypothetical protein
VVHPNSLKKVGKRVVTCAGDGEPEARDVSRPETNPKSGPSAQGPPQTLSADILWGSAAIADYLGLTLSEVQYLIRHEKIPIGRLGPKLLFASKRQLHRHLTSETQLALRNK